MAEATGYLHTLATQLFLVPCQVALVISATRMYRGLANFSSPVGSYDITSIRSLFFSRSPRRLCHCRTQPEDSAGLRAARSANTSKQSPFVHVPSGRLEVTVHKAYEEHAMSHADHFSTSYPSSNGQLHDKPHDISFDDNMDGHAKI